MQKISNLSPDTIEDIEAKRDWVRNHYEPDSIHLYDEMDGKLNLLDVILKSGWINNDETLKLQCLGITLGDVFVQDMGFSWVEIEDEYGVDPALLLPNTSIKIFPLTMISKRIEQGETVNIYELYNGMKRKIEDLKSRI